MPHRNRVLVVDDKPEDGEAIVRRLWSLQIPCFFLHYDPSVIEELKPEKRFDGIRVIFQDIALVSSDFPGHDDFSAAASGIDRILTDNNGPWLLVAWSTWGDDPDQGDKYAKDLFNFLQTRLPEGKRPYHFTVIDKQPYVANREHGEVKSEADFSEDDKDALTQSVSAALSSVEVLNALILWESNVKKSSSRMVNELWQMVEGQDIQEMDKGLGGLLFKLAQAQDGERLSKTDDISSPLYQILSNLLLDKVSHIETDKLVVNEKSNSNICPDPINTMLHWDNTNKGENHPGTVYLWPLNEEIDFGNLNIEVDKLKDFVIDSFVANDLNKRKAALEDQKFDDHAKLVIMDITAACDFANNKTAWKRMIVGVQCYDQASIHFYTGGKKKAKLAGDYLKDTPKFTDDSGTFRFIFNSRLVFSIRNSDTSQIEVVDGEPSEEHSDKMKLVGRLREQILQEVIFWSGSMAARPGIVSLR